MNNLQPWHFIMSAKHTWSSKAIAQTSGPKWKHEHLFTPFHDHESYQLLLQMHQPLTLFFQLLNLFLLLHFFIQFFFPAWPLSFGTFFPPSTPRQPSSSSSLPASSSPLSENQATAPQPTGELRNLLSTIVEICHLGADVTSDLVEKGRVQRKGEVCVCVLQYQGETRWG